MGSACCKTKPKGYKAFHKASADNCYNEPANYLEVANCYEQNNYASPTANYNEPANYHDMTNCYEQNNYDSPTANYNEPANYHDMTNCYEQNNYDSPTAIYNAPTNYEGQYPKLKYGKHDGPTNYEDDQRNYEVQANYAGLDNSDYSKPTQRQHPHQKPSQQRPPQQKPLQQQPTQQKPQQQQSRQSLFMPQQQQSRQSLFQIGQPPRPSPSQQIIPRTSMIGQQSSARPPLQFGPQVAPMGHSMQQSMQKFVARSSALGRRIPTAQGSSMFQVVGGQPSAYGQPVAAFFGCGTQGAPAVPGMPSSFGMGAGMMMPGYNVGYHTNPRLSMAAGKQATFMFATR